MPGLPPRRQPSFWGRASPARTFVSDIKGWGLRGRAGFPAERAINFRFLSIPSFNSFDSTARRYDQGSTRKILSLPGADPELNLMLAYWNDELVGFTYTAREESIKRVVLTGGVINQYQHRGIGRSLLISALEDIDLCSGYVCHVQTGERQKELVALLKSLDFPVNKSIEFWIHGA